MFQTKRHDSPVNSLSLNAPTGLTLCTVDTLRPLENRAHKEFCISHGQSTTWHTDIISTMTNEQEYSAAELHRFHSSVDNAEKTFPTSDILPSCQPITVQPLLFTKFTRHHLIALGLHYVCVPATPLIFRWDYCVANVSGCVLTAVQGWGEWIHSNMKENNSWIRYSLTLSLPLFCFYTLCVYTCQW